MLDYKTEYADLFRDFPEKYREKLNQFLDDRSRKEDTKLRRIGYTCPAKVFEEHNNNMTGISADWNIPPEYGGAEELQNRLSAFMFLRNEIKNWRSADPAIQAAVDVLSEKIKAAALSFHNEVLANMTSINSELEHLALPRDSNGWVSDIGILNSALIGCLSQYNLADINFYLRASQIIENFHRNIVLVAPYNELFEKINGASPVKIEWIACPETMQTIYGKLGLHHNSPFPTSDQILSYLSRISAAIPKSPPGNNHPFP